MADGETDRARGPEPGGEEAASGGGLTGLLAQFRRKVGELFGSLEFLEALVRGGAAVLLIQVASFALRYLTQLGLVHWMGASNYGTYVFAISIATMLAIPAGMGFPTAVLRYVPQYQDESQWGLMRGVIRCSWWTAAGVGASLAILGGAVVSLLHSSGHLATPESIYLGLALTPLVAIMTIQRQLVRATDAMVLAYAPSYIGRHLLLLLGVAVLFQLDGTVDSAAALWVAGAAIATVVLVQGATWLRKLPDTYREASPRYEVKHWLRVALPLLLVAGFNVILDQTDLFLLGVLRPSADVGVYNIALKSSVLVTFILTGVNAVAAPRIARVHHEASREKLQELVSTVAHLAFWPSLAVALGLAAGAVPLLELFGSEFVRGRWALLILIGARLCNTGVGVVGYLMNLTGHQDQSSRVFGWSALLNVVLNLMLIPRFGIEGAAVASAATMILWNVWLARLVRRNLNVDSSVLGALRWTSRP